MKIVLVAQNNLSFQIKSMLSYIIFKILATYYVEKMNPCYAKDDIVTYVTTYEDQKWNDKEFAKNQIFFLQRYV